MRARLSQRVPCDVPTVLYLSFGGQQDTRRYIGALCDISALGCQIDLTESFGTISPGAQLQLSVERNNGEPGIQVAGSVVGSVLRPDGTHRLHVRFDRTHHDLVRDIGGLARALVELNPYGWTNYRQMLSAP